MGKKIAPERWKFFFARLEDGATRVQAAKEAGISMSTVERLFRDPAKTSGMEHFIEWRSRNAPGAHHKSKAAYTVEAQEAREDFAKFRRRYFGRVPVPWQTQLAQQVVKWIDDKNRVYVVVNVAPGAGKTTVLRDLVCWLLCRDRSLRIMWGSRKYAQALLNVNKIRDEFVREFPAPAPTLQKEQGLAFDAEATLPGDFGRFKPDKDETEFWTRERFTVIQDTNTTARDKEPSLTAFGFDGSYLGGRYDVCIWDDVDDVASTNSSPEVRENFFDQWAQVAENRLEPGGLFLVVGQRLSAFDLYRHCLDKYDADGSPIYQHVVYPAHFEELCQADHAADAKPWPDGCLLDPARLPWNLLVKKAGDRRAHYRVTYQQEDADPSAVLVPRLWIDGGTDHETGEDFPGCWDDYRLGELPKRLPAGVRSLITIDPSGTKYWAIEGWLVHPESEQSWLVEFVRETLTMDEVLTVDLHTREYSGAVEDVWLSMFGMGYRPTHLVAEYNAAQRHIFFNNVWSNWRMRRGVVIVPHHTGRNKADPELGLDTLRDPFRYGRIHLPGRSKPELKVFVDEHTNHPAWPTDDTVMANWFRELTYRRLFPPVPDQPYRLPRPSWVAHKNRYVAA